VRLVDGEQRDRGRVEEALRNGQALRCEVEHVELAREQPALDVAALVERLGGVEEGRAHAQLLERIDLVVHERDERADDDAGALAHERRDLVAEALAAAGGHEHDRVAAGDELIDDLGLLAAEGVVAPHAGERLERRRRLGRRRDARRPCG